MGGNCWSRGPESQKTSGIWLGGVSAVISASDLDVHSFGVGRYKSNEHEGALPDPRGSLESEDGMPGSQTEALSFTLRANQTASAAADVWLCNFTRLSFCMTTDSPIAYGVSRSIRTSRSMRNEMVNGLIVVLTKRSKTSISLSSSALDC